MAATVEHARAIESDGGMHPFFQRGRREADVSQPPPVLASPDPDAAITTVAAMDNYDQNQPGNVVSACQDPAFGWRESYYPALMSTNPTSSHMPGPWRSELAAPAREDIETHENGRRKRRKVSMNQEASTSEEDENIDPRLLNDRPLDTGAEDDGPVQTPIDRLQFTTMETTADTSVAARETNGHETMPVPVPVPVPALTPKTVPNPSEGHTRQQTENGPTKTLPLTPKKQAAQLDGNGQPSKSPVRSPRRSPRTRKTDASSAASSNPVKPSAKTSRKVEMKNGKLVSSMRVILPYKSTTCGQKIDSILTGQGKAPVPRQPKVSQIKNGQSTIKSTHPFFLGKMQTQKLQRPQSAASSVIHVSDDESGGSPKAAKPWKDLVFASKKSSQAKLMAGPPPLWPPLEFQHVRLGSPRVNTLPGAFSALGGLKLKQQDSEVKTEEDVLQIFRKSLREASNKAYTGHRLHLPQRLIWSGKQLNDSIRADKGDWHDNVGIVGHPAIRSLQSRTLSRGSAFDLGKAAGPHMWTHEFAPNGWQETMQPQSQILYDWLSKLVVHNVQSGNAPAKGRPKAQKKRRKRRSDDLGDFIASSDDEDDKSAVKNAILITGPHGCGKTASVYAVARQLGFEVFEIHPGSRRSGKDIVDRVGDMTQNHLVQQATALSRSSSTLSSDADFLPSSQQNPLSAAQQSMSAFMSRGKLGKPSKTLKVPTPNENKPKLQKQSLILFEEVDILFEDDRGFWSGVQSLIHSSKRPVIMTCNDPSSIPGDDLNLFATLTYEQPSVELATEFLTHLAGAEGHHVARKTAQNLYLSRQRDLRAAITELNLWCQMTVGSLQGGLDWMASHKEKLQAAQDGSVTRIVSKDTFINGQNLLPDAEQRPEDLVWFAQEQLDLPAKSWLEDDCYQDVDSLSNVENLDRIAFLADGKSAADLMDENSMPLLLASAVCMLSKRSAMEDAREKITHRYLSRVKDEGLTKTAIADSLDALMDEPRIGLPVSGGRKAPSLDTGATSMVTDVAPYVRHVVAYDCKLALLRQELAGGPQPGKQRRTRAARAALEGGDKASMRRERWFPNDLNAERVLMTGGNWPRALPDAQVVSAAESPESMEMETEMDLRGHGLVEVPGMSHVNTAA